MLNRRVAAILIPRFATALFCRENPTLLLEAVALVEDDSDAATIIEVNGKAAKAGVTVGMTAAQGLMLNPGLVRITRNAQREKEETANLLELLRGIVPFVNADTPGLLIAEAEGFERLYGGESQLAQRLITAIKNYGLPAQVGIADNQFVAKVAAEISHGYSCTIVPPFQAQSFLQSLPVKHLPLSAEFKAQLGNLGLRTIQQVAQFPANEIRERFGREGWLASRLARGEDPDFFVPETPPADWQEEIYLGFAIHRAEQISHYVGLLLEKLFAKLKTAGKSCTQFTVQLRCDDRSRHALEIAVDKPSLIIERFLRQLRCKLAELDLPAGVVELGVGPVITISQANKQLALPAADCRSGANASSAVTVLTSTNQPLYPVLRYAPLPERSFQFLPQQPSGKTTATITPTFNVPYCRRSLVGLRLLESAQELEGNDDPLTLRQFKWRGRRRRVASQSGPWLVSGNWWEEGFDRRYYEIETGGGEAYLCFFDSSQHRWYLQGVFD